MEFLAAEDGGEEELISQGVDAMKEIMLLGQRVMGTKGGVDVSMTVATSLALALLVNGRIPFGALYLVRFWPYFCHNKARFSGELAFCLAGIEHDSFLDGRFFYLFDT